MQSYPIALFFQFLVRIMIFAASFDDVLALCPYQGRHSAFVGGHVVQQLLHSRLLFLLFLLGKDEIALEFGPVQNTGIAVGGHSQDGHLPAKTQITSGITCFATCTHEPPLSTKTRPLSPTASIINCTILG